MKERSNRYFRRNAKECEGAHRGLQIVQYAKVYRFATKKEHASYYQKIEIPTAASLSQAALETLAIVAYRQPITRTEMEEIRGVKLIRRYKR